MNMNCKTFTLFLAALYMGIGTTHAQSSCVADAQCHVIDGSTEIRTNENFQTDTSGAVNAALVATDESVIQGTGLKITTATGSGFFGAYLASQGNIHLSDSTISSSSYGVYMNDSWPDGTNFSMTGGSITADDIGLFIGANAQATLNDVNIFSNGNERAIHMSGLNTTLTMTGGSLMSTTAGGISFGGNNTLNLTDVNITSAGGYAITGDSGSGAVLNMIRGTLTYTGNQRAIGLNGTGLIDGTKIVSTARGINLMDGGIGVQTTLLARNMDLTTTGNGAIGLVVSRISAATLENSSIRTQGNNNAYGIWVFSSSSEASVHTQNTTIETQGNAAAHGVVNQGGTANLVDTHIITNGNASYGIYSDADNTAFPDVTHADTTMTGGSITVNATNSIGAWALRGGKIVLDDVKVKATNNGRGVLVYPNSNIEIRNHSEVTASATAPNTIKVENSTITSDSMAVYARGGNDLLDVKGGTIKGDRLVHVTECTSANNCPTGPFAANLNLRAQDSQLFGHASLNQDSTLRMNLLHDNTWNIRPSTSGQVQSDISEITFGGESNHIIFDQNDTGLWQTLIVGSGVPTNSTVYNLLPGASSRITLNTRLNSGGDLGNQFTDRLLINGDVEGDPTVVHVNAATGSPGGWTSPSGNFLANEGISLVQVSGKANEDAFALDGGYVTLGGTPYLYNLYAYGPGSSNGLADENQRLVNNTGNPFWDWRLQSTPGSGNGSDPGSPGSGSGSDPGNPGSGSGSVPMLVPQAATYLTTPTALFQVGLLDIGSLHRRLGEAHRTRATSLYAVKPLQLASSQTDAQFNLRSMSQVAHDEFFLRGYGGKYQYASNLGNNDYGFDADIQYAAIQGGGSIYGLDTAKHRLRLGLAASIGTLIFEPVNVVDSQRTKIHSWNISPTFTWQNAAGTYVDAIVSYGKFKGDVTTKAIGKTATLRGQSLAASVETGTQISMNKNFTLEPQAQVVYQRLKFKRAWAQDLGGGFPVDLGTLNQWTLRAGGLVRTVLETQNGDVQIYAKAHVAHTLRGGQKVWLGDDFKVGKSGTVLETGVGIDAALARGKTRIYGDVIRMNRIGRAGNQGWAVNFGVRILF